MKKLLLVLSVMAIFAGFLANPVLAKIGCNNCTYFSKGTILVEVSCEVQRVCAVLIENGWQEVSPLRNPDFKIREISLFDEIGIIVENKCWISYEDPCFEENLINILSSPVV
jgi:hypothetical protein